MPILVEDYTPKDCKVDIPELGLKQPRSSLPKFLANR